MGRRPTSFIHVMFYLDVYSALEIYLKERARIPHPGSLWLPERISSNLLEEITTSEYKTYKTKKKLRQDLQQIYSQSAAL